MHTSGTEGYRVSWVTERDVPDRIVAIVAPLLHRVNGTPQTTATPAPDAPLSVDEAGRRLRSLLPPPKASFPAVWQAFKTLAALPVEDIEQDSEADLILVEAHDSRIILTRQLRCADVHVDDARLVHVECDVDVGETLEGATLWSPGRASDDFWAQAERLPAVAGQLDREATPVDVSVAQSDV